MNADAHRKDMCRVLSIGLAVPLFHSLHIDRSVPRRPCRCPARPTRGSPDALIAKMRLDEKLAMLHGVHDGYVGNVQGNTRLGIPPLNLNDGP